MKTKRLLFLLTGAALLLTACDLEHYDNGALDGLWKLQAVDTLSNGKHTDTSNTAVTFAIQAKLLQLSGGSYSVLCRFSHEGDSLVVYDPYIFHNTPATDPSYLIPYGFTGLRQAFRIEQITRKKMVLRTDALRLRFEKY